MMRGAHTTRLTACAAALGLLVSVAPSGPPVLAQSTARPADDTTIRPFRIDVPDDVLADLKARLRNPRIPAPLQGDGWELGTDTAYLRQLVTYWRDSFDWRAQERKLNAMEQFTTTIDGLRRALRASQGEAAGRVPAARHARLAGLVCRVHEDHRPAHRSGGARRPGRRCVRCGDAVDSRLHVFRGAESGRLRPRTHRRNRSGAHGAPGLRALRRAGRRLGLDHQHAGGGARRGARGRLASEHVHRRGPGRQRSRGRSHRRREGAAQGAPDVPERRDRLPADPGHQAANHRHRAQRLAGGAGRLDRREVPHLVRLQRQPRDDLHQGRTAHQHHALLGDADGRIVRAHLLREPASHERAGAGRIEVPTACADFPKEIIWSPRRWLETRYNVTRWTEMPRGGHFAAMEQPQLLVDDVRAFFRTLR